MHLCLNMDFQGRIGTGGCCVRGKIKHNKKYKYLKNEWLVYNKTEILLVKIKLKKDY